MPKRRGNRRRPNQRKGSTKLRGKSYRPANAALHDVRLPEPMMLPSTQTTHIQLRGYAGCASTAGGIISTYISTDPSATMQTAFGSITQFNEWSSIAGLYQEVKLLQFEVQLVRMYADETKGDVWGPIAIASTSSSVLTSPGTYQQVIDNGDSQLWSVLGDQSGMNRYHAFRMTQLAWGTVSLPNGGSTSGIAAGCPGSIIFYANALPASSTIFAVKFSGLYLLRTRI